MCVYVCVCVCVWSLLGVACLFRNTWHTECGHDVDKMGTHTPVCVCVCVCVCMCVLVCVC